MELLFVRHGQPAYSEEGVNVSDPRLTEQGLRQAELLARRLRSDPGPSFTELLVSPMRRALETARPVAEALGLRPRVLDWLAEIGMPTWWEGATEEQVREAFQQARGRSPDEWWEGMPGGESFKDFHLRITEGLRQALAERHVVRFPDAPPHLWHVHRPEQRVIVVAHNGTSAAALGYLLGLEPVPWEWERFVLRHTSLARVRALELAGGWVWSLRSFSDVEHLPDDLRTR